MHSRAVRLHERARLDAHRKGIPFSLSRAWVLDRLQVGVCEATGIEFDLRPANSQDGLAPTIYANRQRGGYTPQNALIVLRAYATFVDMLGCDGARRVAQAIVERS